MKEILSNPIYAFGCLALCVLVGWFIFVKLYQCNELQWKRADYLWLSLSTLGLFALLADNRIIFSKNELEICKIRIKVNSREIRDQLNVFDQYYCNTKFNKTEDSPANYDDIKKDFDSMCNWTEINYSKIDSMLNAQQIIDIENFQKPLMFTDVVNNMANRGFNILMHFSNEYNNYITEKQLLATDTKHYEHEDILKILSPLLLILGLSVRFLKALGEVNLIKQKRATKN